MIEVEHITSVRKPEKPDVVISRMDYVIICQVIERLNEIGMSDDELSFLLGKPNNYVFGFIVKPNDKNRFHKNQIDLLPYLLDCPFSRIIVNGTASGDIHLHHTKLIKEEVYKGLMKMEELHIMKMKQVNVQYGKRQSLLVVNKVIGHQNRSSSR